MGPTDGAVNHFFKKKRYLLQIGVNSKILECFMLSKQFSILKFQKLIYLDNLIIFFLNNFFDLRRLLNT